MVIQESEAEDSADAADDDTSDETKQLLAEANAAMNHEDDDSEKPKPAEKVQLKVAKPETVPKKSIE